MNPTLISNNGGFCYDECLLPEILVSLPVKDVFRFKCVSRRWLSVISDPAFARFYVSTRTWTWLSYPLCSKYFETITGSPCSLPSSSLILHSSDHDNYFVQKSSYGLLLCLASPDDVVTGYKVVQLSISCSRFSAILNLDIFSSETGEWTTTKVYCPQGLSLKRARFKPITLNWILYVPNETNNALIRYDLDSNHDECQCLPLPTLHKKSSKRSRTSYGVCKGDLRCIYMKGQKNVSLELWVLKDDKLGSGEWFLEQKVQLSYINAEAGKFSLCSLYFHPSDTNLVYLQFLEKSKTCFYDIAVCNLHTGEVEVCQQMPPTRFMLFLPPLPTPIPQPSLRAH
ncbi:hypothetical protein PTKIN_Ptkin07bG0038500 [Pterospermum kingtungense]